MSRSHLFITGTISYTPRKITLTSEGNTYFVKPYSIRAGYVHGDRVKARITKGGDGNRMAEVEIIHLIERSHEVLLATVIYRKSKAYLKIIPEQGNVEIPYSGSIAGYSENDIVSIRCIENQSVKILDTFGKDSDVDIEERLILFLAQARTIFGKQIEEEGERIKKSRGIINLEVGKGRTDFSNWYTLTIDGADAKDLDDAISLRQEENGDYTLVVHIADVAEYVEENSAIDREALMRGTSIYTPGKVIPMLPEVLSNDLCSLHPGTKKLTLSCVMHIDPKGYVKKADIVEGIIESRHRGVYENIAMRYELLPDMETNLTQESHDSLESQIKIAFSLYHILEKRRRKEGKITFESTEIYFDFGNKSTGATTKTPISIKKRERNDAHKLIEEFMVLANEEVAKWCDHHGLPFLSRVHGLPGHDQTEIIQAILGQNTTHTILEKTLGQKIHTSKPQKHLTLEPTHIREFLENIDDSIDMYRYSRLLLPKMAKATYSDKPFRHFGLALEYYSHFTSPIRRYPDLQVHRIIKEKIRGTLSRERIEHYTRLLKKVAQSSTEHEHSAEDIERAMNSLYACRYMKDKIGTVYSGQISGLSEFAIFIELENGIETTLYLPRGKYTINSVEGILSTSSSKKIGAIGESIHVKIESVNMAERRVVAVKL